MKSMVYDANVDAEPKNGNSVSPNRFMMSRMSLHAAFPGPSLATAPTRCGLRLCSAPRRGHAGYYKLSLPSSILRAEPEDTSGLETPKEEPPLAATKPEPQAAKDPAVQRGQVVAIITGGISLAIAVFYLALVQILDVRGGEMLPPPPEALNIDCIDCSLLLRR
ncbi:hypothetical protein F751_4421 [Auxenochlorella protothecoides]|uniref:Uncharacterized protein n=1 Tax=Auxenochlorella protothecoides TaxID=3075 RepID=A0A087SCT5_AUXPR|nr:hypothetical protein F751_4421 [Auxenochlorella protothecoides]KFM23539.1 hypothetical protein F751_4421 [Auxenochlorella protothecoides]